jgi:5-oxoprolinase (ATP-hydrolysing) subunit A
MTTVDLNSDLGKGIGAYRCGDDEAMLSIVTSANVACGFHAGDPEIMARTFRDLKGTWNCCWCTSGSTRSLGFGPS